VNRLESPDRHFAKKLASITSTEEMDGFRKGLWDQRRPHVTEREAMNARRDELKRRGR